MPVIVFKFSKLLPYFILDVVLYPFRLFIFLDDFIYYLTHKITMLFYILVYCFSILNLAVQLRPRACVLALNVNVVVPRGWLVLFTGYVIVFVYYYLLTYAF